MVDREGRSQSGLVDSTRCMFSFRPVRNDLGSLHLGRPTCNSSTLCRYAPLTLPSLLLARFALCCSTWGGSLDSPEKPGPQDPAYVLTETNAEITIAGAVLLRTRSWPASCHFSLNHIDLTPAVIDQIVVALHRILKIPIFHRFPRHLRVLFEALHFHL